MSGAGHVRITEVGPRDGLQNTSRGVSTAAKIAFVDGLTAAGFKAIECTSFVHPRAVPAMADAEAVFAGITRAPGVRYIALTPNLRGYERARLAACDTVALFTAASEAFTRANINMTIAESLERFAEVADVARADGVALRGYVSTVFACPYEGPIRPEAVLPVVEALFGLGCYEVSLGDTIGVGTPHEVDRLLSLLVPRLPVERLAMHFHDTWGMGAANITAALAHGVRAFDASAGGLGGCPYAPGATGNVATEDVVYLLQHMGYDTGIDLQRLVDASQALGAHMGVGLPSRVHQAVLAGRRSGRGE